MCEVDSFDWIHDVKEISLLFSAEVMTTLDQAEPVKLGLVDLVVSPSRS